MTNAIGIFLDSNTDPLLLPFRSGQYAYVKHNIFESIKKQAGRVHARTINVPTVVVTV